MTLSGESPRELRVVASRIDLGDVSARVLFPTPEQGPWTPFARFADTTLARHDDPGAHPHRDEEVLTYVIEGNVREEEEGGRRASLEPDSIVLLAAVGNEVSHKLLLGDGDRARWLSIVLSLRAAAGATPRTWQRAKVAPPVQTPDGMVERRIVSAEGPLHSAVGLECHEIELPSDRSCVCPIGSGRRGVAYPVAGAGDVDGRPVSEGVGALVEGVSSVVLRGCKGSRFLLATAPRRAA